MIQRLRLYLDSLLVLPALRHDSKALKSPLDVVATTQRG